MTCIAKFVLNVDHAESYIEILQCYLLRFFSRRDKDVRLMQKYQYSESRHGGTTYVETDCWYLLDLPNSKNNFRMHL